MDMLSGGLGLDLLQGDAGDDVLRGGADDLDTLDGYQAPFLMLQAHIDLKQRAELWMGQPWRLGLSAVIEENSGRKSYWALKHPDGPPDFHRADCFTLELPAARPA